MICLFGDYHVSWTKCAVGFISIAIKCALKLSVRYLSAQFLNKVYRLFKLQGCRS